MRRLGKILVCLTAALSISTAVFAEDMPLLISSMPQNTPVLISTDSSINSLSINGKSVPLETLKVYNEAGHVMVPLRVIGEELGFDLTWNKEEKSVLMDNGTVQTTLLIGKDSYFKSSSTALGLTRPVELGVAPTIINGTTYVPVELLGILYSSNDIIEVKENTLYITTEAVEIPDNAVQIPSPLKEVDSVEEVKSMLGLDAIMPKELNGNYILKSIHVIADTVGQLTYENADSKIVLRVAKGNSDISGDYTIYENEDAVNINGIEVTLKGNGDLVNSMIWHDEEKTCSIQVQAGLVKADAEQLVKTLM